MRFDLLTIFPEIFDSYLNESIIKRAKAAAAIQIFVHDIRKFSKDKHHKVDSPPYGGGPGMVMAPQPVVDCIRHVKTLNAGPVVYMSPKGKILTQNYAEKLVKMCMKIGKSTAHQYTNPLAKTSDHNGLLKQKNEHSELHVQLPNNSPAPGLILLCGRYEGIDQRAIDLCVDLEISIGKYVLTGGELPAMVVIDVLSRLIPGVLGDDESSAEETFSKALKGKKEYPHYTRPEVFEGLKVPEVLISGHHAKIKKWREDQLS